MVQLPPFQMRLPPTRAEIESRYQELKRDFTTPMPVFYIVIAVIMVLLIIAGMVLVFGFHF